MLNYLLDFCMIAATGASLGKGIFYNKMASSFDFKQMLEKYQENLNQGTKSLSFVEPDFSNREILAPFYEILKKNVTDKELILVTNRIKNIRVKKGLFSLTNKGEFFNGLNLIKYYDKTALMHEFLHMASSYFDNEKGIFFCGFASIYKYTKLGVGLTEGFTELFAARFEERKVHSYKPLTEICEMLEILFDEENDARKLYFRCDLPSFVKKLQEYMSSIEVFNLLREMDDLVKTDDAKKAYNLKVFIYKKFIRKDPSPEKLKVMVDVIKDEDALTIFDDALESGRKNKDIEERSISQYFRTKAQKQFKKTAATAALCTSILLTGSIVKGATRPFLEASNFVGANITDSYSVLLNDDYYFTQNQDGIHGSDLCRALLAKGIQYFEVNGEYYTKDGGNLTIEECEITLEEYVKEAVPVIQDGVIVKYIMGEIDDSNKEYAVKDGKVYALSYINYKQAKLADGSLVTPVAEIVKDIEGHFHIGIINSFNVDSKPYEELKGLNLIYEEQDEVEISNKRR